MSNFEPPYGQAPPPPPPYGQVPPPPPPGFRAPHPYVQQPPAYQRPNYAGFWGRAGAGLLDGLIMIAVAVPIGLAVVLPTFEVETEFCTVNGNAALCKVPTNQSIAFVFLAIALWAIMQGIYHVYFVGKTGQTLGRKAAGIRVVSAEHGRPIGYGRAFGRYLLATFVSGNICYLGYLWHLWDDQKQTWHDKVAGSIVVRS